MRNICEFSLFFGFSGIRIPPTGFLAWNMQLNSPRLASAISVDDADAGDLDDDLLDDDDDDGDVSLDEIADMPDSDDD